MSLSFANNNLTYDNGGNDSLGCTEIVMRIIFVKENEEMTDILKLAYEAITEKFIENHHELVEVITEEECRNMPKATLKTGKKKIFVFENFDEENEAFAYVQSVGNIHIFGARAFLTIILEGLTSPYGIYHVHNMTMRKCVISATNVPKDKKKIIRKLVNYMGGHYYDDLKSNVTHLVSEGVGSEKYEVAAKTEKIKIMHSDWIYHMWKNSQNVTQMRADESQFDRFKLPIFFNLTISSTGLSVKMRDEIKAIIEENGGKYSGVFNSKVDILIVDPKSVGEKKHEAAIKMKKTCLTSEWIYESVRLNYAASLAEFLIQSKTSVKASTPTKSNATASNFNPDNTQISEISYCYKSQVSFAETVISSSRVTRSSFAPTPTIPTTKTNNESMFTNQQLNDARKLGNILDGFNIYLDGISKDSQLLCKILSVLGAMKFNELGHNITHVLVGKMSSDLFKKIQEEGIEPQVLQVEWVKKILETKSMVNEKEYEVINPTKSKQVIEPPSPASKRLIRSMSFKKPQTPKFSMSTFDQPEPQQEQEPELDIINQYLEAPPHNATAVEPSVVSSNSTVVNPFFKGKNVFIYGFDDGDSAAVVEICEKYGATLVDPTFNRVVDYVICPNNCDDFNIAVKYKNLVSDQWLIRCEEQVVELPMELHYRPTLNPNGIFPLQDEILVVTNYKGDSRMYVKYLIEQLGAIGKEQLRKVENPIVITDSTVGEKFKSAKSWGLTCLDAEWLYSCNRERRRVDETPFLIGGTKPSERNLKVQKSPKSRPSVVPSSQMEDNYDIYDPPVENIREDEPEPSPVEEQRPPLDSRVQAVIDEMPTPIRKVTLAALNDRKILSPRRLALKKTQQTPETSRSPSRRPGLRVRPDETPNTSEHHKRRLEELDKFFIEPSDKRSKSGPVFPELPDPSPPYRYRRHDYYRRVLDNYNSPDPREIDNLKVKNPTLSNLKLNFEDNTTVENNEDKTYNTETEGINCFAGMNKEVVPRRRVIPMTQMSEDIDIHPFETNFENPIDSENLVEWDSGSSNALPTKFFCFSLIKEDLLVTLPSMIEELNGKVDSVNFTHLITPMPTKGEKYLTGMARGAYLLHHKYLADCQASNGFLDEAKYEFGNPASNHTLMSQRIDGDLASAGFRWRNWIKITHRDRFPFGAFSNVVFVMLGGEKMNQMANVITGGGGRKVEVDFTNLTTQGLRSLKINHCFVDPKKPLKSEIRQIFVDAGVKVLPTSSILKYLISKEVPNEIPN